MQPLKRSSMLDRIRKSPNFDVVVIGGGASGLGVALDAAARGLRVALFEAQDFASGTSARSGKVIHAAVESVINPVNWQSIQEGLYERRLLLTNAAQLVRAQRFVVPCYSWLQVMRNGVQLALYGLFSSGGKGVRGVNVAGANASLGLLPGVVRRGMKAVYAYSDAQFDDAALAMALMQTAVAYGAVVLNYASVVNLNNDGRRITSVMVRDEETQQTYEVKGKVVFNCAGVWADGVRRMADPSVAAMTKISRCSYVVVDKSFLPTGNALVLPRTKDGRTMHALVWQGSLVLGSTDVEQGQAYRDPEPSPDEVAAILSNVNRYLTRRIRPEDVKATFSGLKAVFSARKNGLNKGTANIHGSWAVVPEFKNLLTIAGADWTNYRIQAEEALKTAQQLDLVPRGGCMTRSLPLIVHARLEQEELQKDLLKVDCYDQEIGKRLLEFVRYCVEYTGARTAKDIIYRRLRIGQLDAVRTRILMPVVARMLERIKVAS